jgi:PmbA protein
MATRDWNLEQLKSQLSARKEVKGWIISQEHVHRRERYFMGESSKLAIDQDRDVRSQSISARIFVRLPLPGRQGEITKKLFQAMPLGPQLDSAIEAALQTDHQEWDLPKELPSKLPTPKTADPKIAEDINQVMSQLTDQVSKAVSRKRPTDFNSAELFLSVHDRELHLSNGLTHRSSQSRIYSEAAYSMSRKGKDGKIESDEYLNTQWSISLGDLSIEELFDETAERAEHSLDVQKPMTGKYSVIVDSEVLAMLFNGHVSQLSAFNAYSRLPSIKAGTEFIPGATGDLVTVTLDPTLDFGADTAALSDQGLAQKPLKLVEKNKVLATAADQQYAQYLGIAPTTVRGNVVVSPGTLSREELTQQAPLVLEVLQFSALFPDPNSGTFSSEIRLAKLYDNTQGTVTYLKGGSLSGSINENLKNARFSKSLVKKAHFEQGVGKGYYGPDYALLNDVSVVG